MSPHALPQCFLLMEANGMSDGFAIFSKRYHQDIYPAEAQSLYQVRRLGPMCHICSPPVLVHKVLLQQKIGIYPGPCAGDSLPERWIHIHHGEGNM